tara:strand:- start:1153 stop:1557 length:405 start_codon:yes stop_codon:yes gene_type:complete
MASIDDKLHWTTVYSEKTLLAVIGGLTMIAAGEQIWDMWCLKSVQLADLFMLFIYTEVLGMVGSFFVSRKIPVVLPIIIAMTAMCRLIILQGKESDPLTLAVEAAAILVLAGAAYIWKASEKVTIEKQLMRENK